MLSIVFSRVFSILEKLKKLILDSPYSGSPRFAMQPQNNLAPAALSKFSSQTFSALRAENVCDENFESAAGARLLVVELPDATGIVGG